MSLHSTLTASASAGAFFWAGTGIKDLPNFAAYLLPHAKSVKWRSPVGALLMLPAGLFFWPSPCGEWSARGEGAIL